MAQGNPLRLEEIDAISEVWEGFSLMERHAVSKENCACLKDIQDRLRLHYQKQLGQGKSTEAAQEVITKIRREDEAKRHELKRLFEATLVALHSLDSQVVSHMIAEGTITKSLKEDLEKYIANLESNECPILVAGETSSGKSSLLNLLLGREILPHRLLSCTSVICRLRYGTNIKAKVIRNDDSSELINLDPKANPLEQLSKYIFKASERDESLPYKALEIYLPLELLKTGIYIIDSPGFGENATMDKLLLDYISNNQIFAFIYVIKSDNAGGVQEDRLQRILKHIVEKQRCDLFGSFDPRAAMFVCNRWDLIPDVEKEVVFQDTLRKLSRSWPKMDPSQVFCLSTTKAWATRQAGYVTEDFSQLLDGIQRLVPIGLQRKIQLSYKFLEHLLSRARHHVAGYLAKTRISAQELQARQRATELRLHKVERESEVIMKKLEKQLDKHVRTISAKLANYLQTEDAKEKMGLWTEDQLPRVEPDDVWADTEGELDCIIEERLTEVVREWDERYRLFQNVQKDLFNTFKEEFLILDSQLSTVENYIMSDELSLSDRSEEDQMRHFALTDNIDPSNGFFNFSFNSLEKVALGVATPVLVPVAVGMLLGAPILLLWDFKKWRRRSIAQKNLITYLENPVGFVTQRAYQTLDKVADIEIISEYVYNQLDPARQYLDSMRAAIPKLVESNRSLIEAIVKDKRTSKELESLFLGLESSIPDIQEHLASYGNLYLREYDFSILDIEVISPPNPIGLKMNPRKAIWTDMRPAKLKQPGRAVPVCIKVYTTRVSALHLINEEMHLRKVKHPHILKLLGTFEAARGIPGFITEPNMVRARQELFGFKALPGKSKSKYMLLERTKRFLEQVSIGLEYLHVKGLVHLELSLDSVMILSNQDQVKLVNLGEPRRANLPSSFECQASEFVYLPPEVLRGGIYRCRGDIYSLGLMAWELWNQELAFKRQRTSRLDHFIQTLRPSLLQGTDDNPFNEIIVRSVHTMPEERLTSTDWVNEIRKVDISKLLVEEDEGPIEGATAPP